MTARLPTDRDPFAPTLSDDRFGISRSEQAAMRSGDLMAFDFDWKDPAVTKPAKADFYLVAGDKIEPKMRARRVLWTGNFFMSDAPVTAWRKVSEADNKLQPHRPVSMLAKQAEASGSRLGAGATGRGHLLDTQVDDFDSLQLVPMDDPMAANVEVRTLGALAKLELRVEVVKFSRPAADASGISSGRVLATSTNYSAQHVGDGVVIHENRNLDRLLNNGEDVTLAYRQGKATVYDGLAHDVNIVADWMPKDQQAYLRMTMLDALANLSQPQDDETRMREALLYALESTATFFGAKQSKLPSADITLVVNETKATVKGQPAPVQSSPARRMARP